MLVTTYKYWFYVVAGNIFRFSKVFSCNCPKNVLYFVVKGEKFKMAYSGDVKYINLTENDNAEAIEIVNILAKEDDRSAAQTATRLIVQAGKARAERIKARKE